MVGYKRERRDSKEREKEGGYEYRHYVIRRTDNAPISSNLSHNTHIHQDQATKNNKEENSLYLGIYFDQPIQYIRQYFDNHITTILHLHDCHRNNQSITDDRSKFTHPMN